jgi:hypothetical protein
MARVFSHPLFFMKALGIEDAQIGASIRYGSRDGTTICSPSDLAGDPKCVRNAGVTYDYPGMSTQGGYGFWSPIYTGDNGRTHVLPSGDQLAVAGELRVPIGRFDLQSEIVYIDNNTREAVEGFQATNTERLGHMFGWAHYTQLGFWALGPRDINGKPGYQNFPHLDFSKPDPETPKHALQVLAKYENVNLSYHSATRAGAVGTKNIDGDINVHAVELGANYWFTKHIRLSANWGYYLFPDSAPSSATNAADPNSPVWSAKQRAQAPGNTLGTHLNDTARNTAHDLHEISLRFAVAL